MDFGELMPAPYEQSGKGIWKECGVYPTMNFHNLIGILDEEEKRIVGVGRHSSAGSGQWTDGGFRYQVDGVQRFMVVLFCVSVLKSCGVYICVSCVRRVCLFEEWKSDNRGQRTQSCTFVGNN